MTIPKGLEHVLKIDPKIMHGALCFAGTSVPLIVFLDNLSEGVGLADFLCNYPTISKDQAEAVLEWEHTLYAKPLAFNLPVNASYSRRKLSSRVGPRFPWPRMCPCGCPRLEGH